MVERESSGLKIFFRCNRRRQTDAGNQQRNALENSRAPIFRYRYWLLIHRLFWP
jgi:hypothetical protein